MIPLPLIVIYLSSFFSEGVIDIVCLSLKEIQGDDNIDLLSMLFTFCIPLGWLLYLYLIKRFTHVTLMKGSLLTYIVSLIAFVIIPRGFVSGRVFAYITCALLCVPMSSIILLVCLLSVISYTYNKSISYSCMMITSVILVNQLGSFLLVSLLLIVSPWLSPVMFISVLVLPLVGVFSVSLLIDDNNAEYELDIDWRTVSIKRELLSVNILTIILLASINCISFICCFIPTIALQVILASLGEQYSSLDISFLMTLVPIVILIPLLSFLTDKKVIHPMEIMIVNITLMALSFLLLALFKTVSIVITSYMIGVFAINCFTCYNPVIITSITSNKVTILSCVIITFVSQILGIAIGSLMLDLVSYDNAVQIIVSMSFVGCLVNILFTFAMLISLRDDYYLFGIRIYTSDNIPLSADMNAEL